MNGIISNTKSRHPKVHMLNQDGRPLCGISIVTFITKTLLNDTAAPILDESGRQRTYRRAIHRPPVIQIDLGEANCKRCLSLKGGDRE